MVAMPALEAFKVVREVAKIRAEQRQQAADVERIKLAQLRCQAEEAERQAAAEQMRAEQQAAAERMRAEQRAAAERMDKLEETQQQQAKHLDDVRGAMGEVALSMSKFCALVNDYYILPGCKRKATEPAHGTPQPQRIRV
jgi:hypothetical protein